MPLPYRLILALLRPAAVPSTAYRADDGSGDFAQVWRVRAGGELMVETLGCEAGRLWRPVPIVTAEQLRREISGRTAVRRY